MIVRILNRCKDYDKWLDCKTTCLVVDKDPEKKKLEFDLIVEFADGRDITLVLDKGDEIYYMNNEGKTINRDMRMLR